MAETEPTPLNPVPEPPPTNQNIPPVPPPEPATQPLQGPDLMPFWRND